MSAQIFCVWKLIDEAKDGFNFYNYIEIAFQTSPSLLDKLTFFAPLVGTYFLSNILALELGGYGKKLEYLTQNHFSYMPSISTEAKTWPLFKHVLM